MQVQVQKKKKRTASNTTVEAPKAKIVKQNSTSTESQPTEIKKSFKTKSSHKERSKDSKPDGTHFKKPLVAGATPEKTDWRKFKEDKKQLKLKRKKAKSSYETCVEAKQIYEQLKCKKTQQKSVLVDKLYALLKGDLLKKVVMAHDTGRIVQCMLKHSSPQLRETIGESLLPVIVDMSLLKYSHFCVMRLLKYGSPAIQSKVVDRFLGHIVRMACHNVSNKVLDYAYHQVATPQQQTFMRQELYGDLYKNTKDTSVSTLADTYKNEVHMKAGILGSVKSTLDRIANKKLVDCSLVHAVLLEYLKECDEEKLEEIITMYSTLIPLMLTTKAGCEAAMLCFYRSSAKLRRVILKAIKDSLTKICVHECGYVFVIAIINSLDDTKAMKKAIFDLIHANLQEIVKSPHGRKVVEWLVAPGNTYSFHPKFVAAMDEGLKYGKKDKEVRRKEILEQIEEPIAKAIAEAPEAWFLTGHVALSTANIINSLSSSNFKTAAYGVSSLICKPDWAITNESNADTIPGIEDPGMNFALKRILEHDAERIKQNQDTFGLILANTLTDDTLKVWLPINRGCFALVKTIELGGEEAASKVKNLLIPHKETLSNSKTPGAKLLLKKLDSEK